MLSRGCGCGGARRMEVCGNSGRDRDPTHDATRPHLFGVCGTVLYLRMACSPVSTSALRTVFVLTVLLLCKAVESLISTTPY